MRLAITGTGMVTSVGADRASSFEAFCRGEAGVKPLVHFEPDRFRLRCAYEIAAPDSGTPRASRWLGQAMGEALEAASVDPAAMAPEVAMASAPF